MGGGFAQARSGHHPADERHRLSGRFCQGGGRALVPAARAPAGGLTELGVSHVTLKPGAWSSQRHWHETEDEFVVMLAGEAVLVDDRGETLLRAGDCAAFPKNDRNGHHLQNRSDRDCVFIAVSAGPRTGGNYPDIDLRFTAAGYFHKDGTPYPTERVR